MLSLPFTDGQRNIYIRSIYPHFFSRILEHRKEIMSLPPHCRPGIAIAITGTPRTGKSCFLIYVAHMLKENSINFVVTLGRKTYNSSFEDADVTKDLHNSSVVHLIDPCFSRGFIDVYPAVTVFFASPTESNFDPYHSKEINTYFMPLWTKEELIDAHSKLSLTFDEAIFHSWGGVFLDSYRSNLLHFHLTKILQSDKLLQLVQVTDDFILSPDIKQCQWLIHRVPSSDYRSCVCEVPSDYVRDKIMEVLDSGIALQYPSNSTLLGHIYERKVLKLLGQNTPDIVIKAYSSNKLPGISDRNFEVLNVDVFTNSSVIAEPTIKTLYKPKESNKEGLDAIYVLSKEVAFIIQATINKVHKPLKVSSVRSTMPNINTWNVCLFYGGTNDDPHYPTVSGISIPPRIGISAKT